MKVIQIKNSYKIWNITNMKNFIKIKCLNQYGTTYASILLNRSYGTMYIEWWLHNIGYYISFPFIKWKFCKNINNRCRDVDLEEWA